jgi:HAD superfamily hydrolase (TIGR01509 family)
MAITTIFFDVGGTLVHPDMEALLAPLLATVQPSAEQLATADRAAKFCLAQNRQSGDSQSHNRGHWRIYFETLLDALALDRPDLLDELTARAFDSSFWKQLAPGTADILAQLQGHYRLAIISNADGRIRQVLQRAAIDHFFEQIVDSGLVGHEKPDPRIFRAGLERMAVTPAESLYIGDIYGIDYRGATGVGMSAVLLDSERVYREWAVPRLDALGELPGWIAAQS